jgi:lactoylglutathione lyase
MHLSYVRVLVDQFPGCFRYYRDTLGFEVILGEEEGPYAEFRVSAQTRLALCARFVIAAVPGVLAGPAPAADRFMLVFEVDDVDRKVEELKGRGAMPIAAPVDRPEWGVRTAHFRDPEGNLVEINKPLAG